MLVALIVAPMIVGIARTRAAIRAENATYEQFLAEMDALKPRKGDE